MRTIRYLLHTVWLFFWHGIIRHVGGRYWPGQQARSEAEYQVLRLASEILAVALTVEEDLQALGINSTTEPLRDQSRAHHGYAEAILAKKQAVARYSLSRLDSLLDQLHDHHRRVVHLRSDVDRLMLVRRGGHDGTRWRTSTKPPRSSSWPPGSSFRPSTVG